MMELETGKLAGDCEYGKSDEIDETTPKVENCREEDEKAETVEREGEKLLELDLSGLKLAETPLTEEIDACVADEINNDPLGNNEEGRENFDIVENGKYRKKEGVSNTNEPKNETKSRPNECSDEGHRKLFGWLNKNMKIEMTDGRILIGIFLCTDRDGNVILGSCSEYINPEVCGFSDEPRILGLVMVPGRHIVSIHHDADTHHRLAEDTSNELCS